MRLLTASVALSAMLMASGLALAGERVAADVRCTATAEKLTYDCMIMLKGKKSGLPVEDAGIVVKADMPSMPLTHNVRPVRAAPGSMPGHYSARLELDMHGEWALTLDVSGPTRDRVVKKLQFGTDAGQTEHMHGDKRDHGGDMGHDEMQMEDAQ